MKQQIQPIATWNADLAAITTITQVQLLSFNNYSFLSESPGYTMYRLLNANDQILAESIIEIPYSVLNIWGEDDSIILDYVVSALGFTAV